MAVPVGGGKALGSIGVIGMIGVVGVIGMIGMIGTQSDAGRAEGRRTVIKIFSALFCGSVLFCVWESMPFIMVCKFLP